MIKLLVADDHKIYVDGISALLKEQPTIELIGTAHSGRQTLDFLVDNRPDVVLLDIDMPDGDGLKTCAEIKARYPNIKVLMLSMHNGKRYVQTAFKNGADGYLLKESGQEECLPAIQMIAAGGQYKGKGVHDSAKGSGVDEVSLSPREMEVLALIAEGLTSKQMADRLFVTENTISHHRKNLHAKTGSNNATSLLAWALENGAL